MTVLMCKSYPTPLNANEVILSTLLCGEMFFPTPKSS